jgi:hypothetical protein
MNSINIYVFNRIYYENIFHNSNDIYFVSWMLIVLYIFLIKIQTIW